MLTKIVSLFAVFVMSGALSSKANAQPVEIPADRLQTYVKAVHLAIMNSHYKCDVTFGSEDEGYNIGADIDQATSGLIDKSGAQPLLTFTSHLAGSDVKGVVDVSSSADLKLVTALENRTYTLQDVNKGTLENPVIVRDYVLHQTVDCQRIN